MLNTFLNIYRFIFARVIFYKLNKLIYIFSLHGLGVLNYETDESSGERAFLTSNLKDFPPNACVIDVGANIGNYSKKVLELAPSVNLFSFEPHPATYLKLRDSIKAHNFTAVNAAVASENGVLSLYDYDSNDGSEHASLFKDVIENIHHSKSIEHKVKVIRLGDFLVSNNIEYVNLLKIDTEGNELAVLMGVSDFLTKDKIGIIHFEFNEMNVSSRTYFRDFWKLMPNYDFYRLLQDGMVPIKQYSPVFNEIFAYQNIIAINRSTKKT